MENPESRVKARETNVQKTKTASCCQQRVLHRIESIAKVRPLCSRLSMQHADKREAGVMRRRVDDRGLTKTR